jgi:phosphatidylserine/phosphatidylglycerophosphate/cardiolipin synthase-like enzyme
MISSFIKHFQKDTYQETSKLFNEHTFHQQFLKDISRAEREIIIESPFITARRMNMFLPFFEKLLERNVSININTTDLQEDSRSLLEQAEVTLRSFEYIGVSVFI